jgi:hypothetical protein
MPARRRGSVHNGIIQDSNGNEIDFRLSRRATAIAAVLEKTDRIVSGKKVAVSVGAYGASAIPSTIQGRSIPAWTDSETIFFSEQDFFEQLLMTASEEFIVRYKGLNYHELSHILFSPWTPQYDVWLRQRQSTHGDIAFYAFNLLEDQRIEMLFSGLYPPAAKYFEAAALKWIIGQGTGGIPAAHPLICKRLYIDYATRQQCKAAFEQVHGPKLAADIENVVGQYIQCVFPEHTAKMQALTIKMMDLLSQTGKRITEAMHHDDCNHSGSMVSAISARRSREASQGGSTPSRKDNNVSPQEAQKARKAVEKQEKADRNRSQSDAAAVAANKGADNADEKGDSGAPGESEGSEAGESPAPSDGAGKGGTTQSTPNIDLESLTDVISDALDKAKQNLQETMSSAEMKRDIESTQDAIRSATNNLEAQGLRATSVPKPAGGELVSKSRKISDILRTLRTDLEPSWIRSQPTGRLNTRRVVQRRADPSVLDLFDQWDEGTEELATVEAVILVDMSGSMSGEMVKASEAMWTLKQAFDRQAIRTTVLGFSDGHVILYKPKDKLPKTQVPIFGVIGGTDPTSALQQAYGIFSTSGATNKVLCILTDGQWWGSDSDIVISSIRRDTQAVTVLLGLHGTATRYGDHNCEITADINQPEDLLPVMQRVVTSLIKKARGNG